MRCSSYKTKNKINQKQINKTKQNSGKEKMKIGTEINEMENKCAIKKTNQ